MNAALALHTAARRYCLERFAFWSGRYSAIARRGADRKPDGYHYTNEALATFPRYNVLKAVRVELERIHPDSLVDLEDTRARLIAAGETAEDDFTRPPKGPIEERAISEERDAYCAYVRGLRSSDLAAVEPLPFRRVLTGEESESLWSRLRECWQILPGYWYPLAECARSDVAAFLPLTFEQALPLDQLRGILATRGVGNVFEFREYGPEYEQALSLFEPTYAGAEGYWSSGGMDWIVYASHENSVTVGGWLLAEVRAAWPDWRQHLWSGG